MSQWPRRAFFVFVTPITAALLIPEAAHAYGGPGSIISGIGALLAVVAAIGAAIFGFVWYPLKKLTRRIRGGREVHEADSRRGQ